MHAGRANRRENRPENSDGGRQDGHEGGRRSASRARRLVVSVLTAAALAGCGPAPTVSTRPDPSAVAATPSAEASASPSASAASAPPPTTGTPAPGTPASSSPSPVLVPTSPAPPAPSAHATVLSMAVATRGGRLDLVRGGPAQEFTVTLRGGNTQAYRHLLLTFQMESLVPEPGDTPGPARSFVLEHQDPATGTWRPAELRVANDLKPYALHSGGAPLARDAVRTERYRLRATATGPTGSSPVVVDAVDTDAPSGAPRDRERPGHFSLPHTTRRP
ncbi:hypothetical protein ABT236_17260 [Streptomyces sp. NPDC001523]|uniref:hypothetical protein n=1 Tax=Streptomyces sp. NPDC001523 TaxID=3154383 RepID=UPI003327ED7F